MQANAPYRHDLCGGPEATAYWLTASDGVRLRVAHVPAPDAKGSVFLFPGRTEYAEKYSDTMERLRDAGLHSVAIDWRGQGLADRLSVNPMVGDVRRFGDYQLDWAAVQSFARAQNLPRPWHLLAHSMGGCIGLRTILSGAEFGSAVFTAPMWGIEMASYLRPVAWALPKLAVMLGVGHLKAPGTKIESYIATEPFATNTLTHDPEMFALMKRHIKGEPKFGLGGPSYRWLGDALDECRNLAARPSPAMPALCFLGSQEEIISPTRIRERMTEWSGGKLLLVDGAKHELLMETHPVRRQVIGAAISLFQGVGQKS